MFQTKIINPTAIVQYISGYEAEFIQEFKASATSPLELVMDYIAKQIDAIDKARIEMRQENPNFLPRLA